MPSVSYEGVRCHRGTMDLLGYRRWTHRAHDTRQCMTDVAKWGGSLAMHQSKHSNRYSRYKDDCYVVAALFMCCHMDKLRCPTLMLCSAEPGISCRATGFTHRAQQGPRPLEYINAYSEGDRRAKSAYG